MKDKIEQIVGKVESGHLEPKEAVDELLVLFDVGNCPFEAYAVFCIECDRKGIKPIKHKDYLNLG
jgi:hypothetical protein